MPSTAFSHLRCINPSAANVLIDSKPVIDSINTACFCEVPANAFSIALRVGISNKMAMTSTMGIATKGITTKLPAIYQIANRNNKINGISINPMMVADVKKSRRFSNSLK